MPNVMILEPLTASFIASLLGEIADKTQLIILGFALKYKAPWKVFFGGLAGHAMMDGVAIMLGFYFGTLFLGEWIKWVVGILFILLGAWTLAKPYLKKPKKEEKDVVKKIKSSAPFAVTFLAVLFTEIGDKTQIATGLLGAEFSASYIGPLMVFIGATLGLALTIGLNVFVGSKLAERLPKKAIKITTAVLFILFGVFTLFFKS